MKYIFKMPSEILKIRANWFKNYIRSNFDILDINSLFVKILKISLSEKNSYLFSYRDINSTQNAFKLVVNESRSAGNQSKLLFAKLSPRKNLSTQGIMLLKFLHLIVQTWELSFFRRISFFFQNLKFFKDFSLFWDHQSHIW